MLTLAGTIVALVSGVVGLLFVLKPDLKPSGKAPKQAATLSQASFEQSAPYSEYLAKTNVPTGPYTKHLLARRGALVGVHVAVTGYEGNHLLLIWKLFAQPSGNQIDESKATTPTRYKITPRNETTERTPFVWVPLPSRPGKFVAHVELVQQEDPYQPLATLDTSPFSGLVRRRS
jgi:hypothetical protein